MVGYVFITESSATNKKYIGKYLSVAFDKNYLGDNPKLLNDITKYGKEKFTVRMLRAAETVKDCEIAYNAMLTKYNALSDPHFYNCEKKVAESKEEGEEAPVKRTRKKRTDEE